MLLSCVNVVGTQTAKLQCFYAQGLNISKDRAIFQVSHLLAPSVKYILVIRKLNDVLRV
ncbi:hypothetical protein LguiA_016891 [Lonicera macranthoides]